MFRTDRGTVVAACLMSALGCLMACALLGFPATGGVRFAWVLLWATASVAGMRFLRVQDRRAKACFGTFGALFVLALALEVLRREEILQLPKGEKLAKFLYKS